jgi:hypothetical protein
VVLVISTEGDTDVKHYPGSRLGRQTSGSAVIPQNTDKFIPLSGKQKLEN